MSKKTERMRGECMLRVREVWGERLEGSRQYSWWAGRQVRRYACTGMTWEAVK